MKGPSNEILMNLSSSHLWQQRFEADNNNPSVNRLHDFLYLLTKLRRCVILMLICLSLYILEGRTIGKNE